MAKKMTKVSIIRSHLEEKNLTKNQIEFVVNLYHKVRNAKDPTVCHVFCDKMAKAMKITTEEVRSLVIFFKGWPYRLTATNDVADFAGFRCTDYFVSWLVDIGVLKKGIATQLVILPAQKKRH